MTDTHWKDMTIFDDCPSVGVVYRDHSIMVSSNQAGVKLSIRGPFLRTSPVGGPFYDSVDAAKTAGIAAVDAAIVVREARHD